MKIKLSVSEEKYAKIRDELLEAGIEIEEDADYELIERNQHPAHLSVQNEDGERMHIKTEDIIFIESFGHLIEVHTAEAVYKTTDRLYQLISTLDPEKFLRVSNSVIIAKKQIRHIKPSFSMKFVLLMSDGSQVDVTRSYYGSFKEAMGI